VDLSCLRMDITVRRSRRFKHEINPRPADRARREGVCVTLCVCACVCVWLCVRACSRVCVHVYVLVLVCVAAAKLVCCEPCQSASASWAGARQGGGLGLGLGAPPHRVASWLSHPQTLGGQWQPAARQGAQQEQPAQGKPRQQVEQQVGVWVVWPTRSTAHRAPRPPHFCDGARAGLRSYVMCARSTGHAAHVAHVAHARFIAPHTREGRAPHRESRPLSHCRPRASLILKTRNVIHTHGTCGPETKR
jgi:hypothetical protein